MTVTGAGVLDERCLGRSMHQQPRAPPARSISMAACVLLCLLSAELAAGQRLGARHPRHPRERHAKQGPGAMRHYDLSNIVHTLSYWHGHKPAIYFSANGVDMVAEQLYFGRQRHGVFVEMGGFGFYGDGMSDTFMFERFRQWTGVLFEAYLDNYRHASARRPGARWVGKGICEEEEGGTGEGSAFAPAEGKQVSAPCEPMGPLLRAAGITSIDLLSINLDGGEAAVLERLMDWSLPVHVVVVALPPGRPGAQERVRAALLAHGFQEEQRVKVKHTAIFVNQAFTPAGAST